MEVRNEYYITEVIVSPPKRHIDFQKVTELAESIQIVGLLNPILVTSDKHLISGLHRLEAFKSLGIKKIPVTVKDYPEIEKDLAQIDEDLIRKHLSSLEQGEFLNKRDLLLSSLGRRAKKGDNQHTAKNSATKTTKDIAKELGKSDRSIQQKKQFAKNLDDSIKDKIRDTPLANKDISLLAMSKLPRKQQAKLAPKLSGTEDKAQVERKINETKREENVRKAHRKARDFKGIDGFEFYTGHFAEICSGIPDNSIDTIITDPPYPPKHLDLWKQLGPVAYRLLKPSGFLVAYTGKNHLPTVINHLLNGKLNYYWLVTIVYSGNHRVPTIEKNVYESTRPVLIFQKPPFKKPKAFVDLITCDGEKEKDLHPWQQSLEPFRYLISHFSKPNDLILEPFSGSGTVALAALIEKRRCISIDDKGDNIKTAKGRIQGYLEKENQRKAA